MSKMASLSLTPWGLTSGPGLSPAILRLPACGVPPISTPGASTGSCCPSQGPQASRESQGRRRQRWQAVGTQAPSICRGIQSIWGQREYLRLWSAAQLLLAWPLRSSEPFLPGGWQRDLFHGHLSFLPLLPAGMAPPPDHCIAPVGVPATAVAPSTSRKRAPLLAQLLLWSGKLPPPPLAWPLDLGVRPRLSAFMAVLKAPARHQQTGTAAPSTRAGQPCLQIHPPEGLSSPMPWGPKIVCSPLPWNLSLSPTPPCDGHHPPWPWRPVGPQRQS